MLMMTVRELQQQIGFFTRGARRGERIQVTDRGEPLVMCVPWREWEQMSEERAEYQAKQETTDDDGDVEALALNALALADGDADAAEVKLLQAALRLKQRKGAK